MNSLEIQRRKEILARDTKENPTQHLISSTSPEEQILVFKKTFLSNMWPCVVTYDGHTYTSTEIPYQYSKFNRLALNFLDKEVIQQIQDILIEKYELKWDGNDLCALFEGPDMQSGMSKKIAHLIPDCYYRDDWDEVKLDVMMDLVFQKYQNNPELRQMLLDTGDKLLVEGNDWGDVYWGFSGGKGNNYLGRLTMMVRDEIRNTV